MFSGLPKLLHFLEILKKCFLYAISEAMSVFINFILLRVNYYFLPLSDAKNIGVILTDGRSDDAEATWQSAMAVRSEQDAFLIAVGIGNNIRKLELEGIASEPVMANVLKVDSFDNLEDIRNTLVQDICNG